MRSEGYATGHQVGVWAWQVVPPALGEAQAKTRLPSEDHCLVRCLVAGGQLAEAHVAEVARRRPMARTGSGMACRWEPEHTGSEAEADQQRGVVPYLRAAEAVDRPELARVPAKGHICYWAALLTGRHRREKLSEEPCCPWAAVEGDPLHPGVVGLPGAVRMRL